MARKKKPKKYGQRLLDKIVDVGVILGKITESEFDNLGQQVLTRAKERGVKCAAWETVK